MPAPQRALWPELLATPKTFTLYGGTALALRLGHRTSIDFHFFSNASFGPDDVTTRIPYLRDSERVQISLNTVKCLVNRGGPVLGSFFGGLGLGQVAAPDQVGGASLTVASMLDLAGTKAAVVQKRAEVKDYLDVDAILRHGVSLATLLAEGLAVYGRKFNPLITLKALSYFDDFPALPMDVRAE